MMPRQVTGAGDVMKQRFYDLADRMRTKPSLSPACVAAEPDWRECMFSETALKYTATPLFAMNSMYNFGAPPHAGRGRCGRSGRERRQVGPEVGQLQHRS